ncbi:helix-turn-helix domain-containing protein [Epidermidibacterium keratini]|uniref:Helix-turn-helix domain-containing protein n=2 Tax=Epidermidibacterium keratini TaxID=1891644 RepID=A0A7L4YTL1_9ACTN|nr:helix-turn-helix domain-containing protein [Epidermidibacterium keratini]
MDLDPVIHAPVRLRIVTHLDTSLVDPDDEVTFPRLQRDLELTAGNLTTHLAKLEQAGYVATSKTFSGRKPVTYVRLTHEGRAAFHTYRSALLKLLGE